MTVVNKKIILEMAAEKDITDVTSDVQRVVTESGLLEGLATVFTVGSTSAVTTLEYEPGLIKDLERALDGIAPASIEYEHHKMWHDDNGRSHVRSAVVGCSLSVPFSQGRLTLGTWQQIVIMNLDTSQRSREIIVQAMGER